MGRSLSFGFHGKEQARQGNEAEDGLAVLESGSHEIHVRWDG